MFSVGDTVYYTARGVCKIKEITEMTVGKEKKQYLVLVPLQNCSAAFYLPTDNGSLINNIRSLLTLKEVKELIRAAGTSPLPWIEDPSKRQEECVAALKSGDRLRIMRLIGMLYRQREQMRESKKHFHLSDERFLRNAENLLYDELAYLLELSPADVPAYILKELEK